ncbi:RS21-C6 protein [bacterium]|nr:RS21-C6 protein [bacterium]
MIQYPDNASLSELQRYVKEKCRERGFDKAEDLETYLLFSEEIGELAKAIRRFRGLFKEDGRTEAQVQAQAQIAEEMADVLSYLLELANRFGVDLDGAFRSKEAINDRRHWS